MAIKKRPVREQERKEAIEAFGDAAELPPGEKATPATPAGQAARSAAPSTMLLRFESDDLPNLLAQVAALEERKKHPMALRALKIGLESILKEYE